MFTISNWKVTALSDVKSGTSNGGNWKRVTVTLNEQNAQHPKSIMLDYAKFGDNLKYFKPPTVGDVVDVEFNSAVRSYKAKDGVERSFNNLSIWSIKTVEGSQNQPVVAGADEAFDEGGHLPF